jgi:formyl-CoA transferase
MNEMWADPQVEHLGMQRPTSHPAIGAVNVVRNAVNIEGVPPMAYRHTAERGEHTAEILDEFGFTADEIADMRTRNVI